MNAALARAINQLDPALVPDLLDEIGARNTLQVSVFRAVRCPVGVRHKRTMKERFACVAQTPALVRQDLARMRAGLGSIYCVEAMRRRGAESLVVVPNLRTNVGIDFCAAQLSGTSVAVADWIAVSANSITPAATDAVTVAPWNTTQATDGTAGEFTGLGLTRAQATYAHTVSGPSSGTTTYTLTKTFTATGTVTGVRVAGLFGGSAKTAQGGTNVTNMLFLESTFTATTLANTDQLGLTWTITI